MNSAIEKLEKYIRLEARRSFDNGAVLGGMERMIGPWVQEARRSDLEESVIDAVQERLRDYHRLSPKSRREVLRGLWTRLNRVADLGDFPSAEASEAQPAPEPVKPESSKESAELDGNGPDEPVEKPAADIEKTKSASTEGSTEDLERKQPKGAPAAREAVRAEEEIPAELDAPLTTISGIGPKSAKTLKKLELETLGDLLWHFPRRYDDYSQLETINRLWYGQEVTIIANVEDIRVRPVRSGKMKLTEATVGDGTGTLRVTWFNQPWIARKLKPGQAVVLSAKVDQYLGKLVMTNPEWEMLDREQLHTNRIVPVYPLTKGVTAKWMRKVMHSVVNRLAPRVPDPLPETVRNEVDLPTLPQALQQVHFPGDQQKLRQARHRLAFDEMFLLQLGVLKQKETWEALETEQLPVPEAWVDRFLGNLPFTLTQGQAQALKDVRADLASEQPMNRLLEGDVGSGKTVIAAAAIGITAHNNAQSAIMAPTSILAEQHYATLSTLLTQGTDLNPEEIQLLLGDTSESQKELIRQGLADGTIKVVVGTHALLEDPVDFKQFGLAIIDEQHRFGVEQRAALRDKGEAPNLLVMTATPIPRSLALTIYGDLDLSIIDELPPGRQPVKTRLLSPLNRSRAYNFILGQLEEGRQAFIIYPLVEESDKVEAKAAVEEHEKLQKEVFFDYNVGLLHGRMKAEEKEQIMSQFRAGELHVLVSTSVVEVGVDIPNASVVVIEGANRFGLAQLHQFRGRVGRSQHESFCLLIPDSDDEMDNERLKAMERTNNGFELAERDLEQRGPGDFFGTRQSGFAEIQMAQLTDVHLIEKARRQAQALFKNDPELKKQEHASLARAVERAWSDGRGDIS
ncbi:MAG: ATP-dependent DNA helicase RecG [Anaerolineales bacterium]